MYPFLRSFPFSTDKEVIMKKQYQEFDWEATEADEGVLAGGQGEQDCHHLRYHVLRPVGAVLSQLLLNGGTPLRNDAHVLLTLPLTFHIQNVQ